MKNEDLDQLAEYVNSIRDNHEHLANVLDELIEFGRGKLRLDAVTWCENCQNMVQKEGNLVWKGDDLFFTCPDCGMTIVY